MRNKVGNMKPDWQKYLLINISLTKTFLWFFTLGFALVCLTCWKTSSFWVDFSLSRVAITMPVFTRLVLYPNTWIIFCPLPWLIYAIVLSRRRNLSRGVTLVFASAIIAATILLVCIIITACALPYRPIYMSGAD
jgi:hypothetical protein